MFSSNADRQVVVQENYYNVQKSYHVLFHGIIYHDLYLDQIFRFVAVLCAVQHTGMERSVGNVRQLRRCLRTSCRQLSADGDQQ